MPPATPGTARELLGVAVVMHRQRQAIGAMPLRHAAQFPQRVLQPFAQALEALREAERHVLPVRVRQHEVVDQVRRTADPGWSRPGSFMCVKSDAPSRPGSCTWAKNTSLAGPCCGLPLPHPPLQRSAAAVASPGRGIHAAASPEASWPASAGSAAAAPPAAARPSRERIGPRPPGVRRPRLAGQLAQLAILACRLAIHARLHRRLASAMLPGASCSRSSFTWASVTWRPAPIGNSFR